MGKNFSNPLVNPVNYLTSLKHLLCPSVHRKKLQHKEKRLLNPRLKVFKRTCQSPATFSSGHNGMGSAPGSLTQNVRSTKGVLPLQREQRPLSKDSALLQETKLFPDALLLLRSHMHTITQLSFTFRHPAEVVTGLQDNLPLTQYSHGETPCFPFIYGYNWRNRGLGKKKN